MSTYWEQQRERSTLGALHLLFWCAGFFGRFLVRLSLWFIAGYFFLTSPRATSASRNALRRLLQREPTRLDVYRHFHYFASCALDRLYFLKGRTRSFKIEVSRPDNVAAVTNRNTGCLLVVAHLGSFEPLRMIGTQQRNLPISILMDRKQGEMLVKLLEKVNPSFALQIIDASQRGPELVLQLRDALQAGRMVCIMGDRAREDERAIKVQFCGDTVRFAEGPWTLASALGVPVILGFGLYRGGKQYQVYFELFTEKLVTSRAARQADIQAHAQRYAQRLEHYARMAPYNWFNFYDYWHDEVVTEESTSS